MSDMRRNYDVVKEISIIHRKISIPDHMAGL